MIEKLQTQAVDNPTGGAELTPESVETVVEGTPTSPEPDEELAALQSEIEQAETPEAKAAAQAKHNKAWAKNRVARKAAEEAAEKERLEAAYYKGKTEALERVVAQPRTVETQTQTTNVPAPTLPAKPAPDAFKDAEGYEDQAAYFEALADWKAECKFIERDHINQQVQAKARQAKADEDQSTWEQAGEDKFPGFRDKVVARLRPALMSVSPQKANDFAVAISESPASHELAVYLADNQRELNRLLAMSTPSALREIGKMEDKLAKPPAKTTTNAPAPIQSVKAADTNVQSLDDIKDDDEWFRQSRKRNMKEKGRAY